MTFNIGTASGGRGAVDGMQQRCHQLEEWRLMSGHERRAAWVTSGFCPALTLGSGKGIHLLSATELSGGTNRATAQSSAKSIGISMWTLQRVGPGTFPLPV